MTGAQREAIKAVIAKDADGRGMLCAMGPDGELEYCILGGLALECGFTPEQLKDEINPFEVQGRNSDGQTLIGALARRFGIRGPGMRGTFMSVNDIVTQLPGEADPGATKTWREAEHIARRARLTELVDSLRGK